MNTTGYAGIQSESIGDYSYTHRSSVSATSESSPPQPYLVPAFEGRKGEVAEVIRTGIAGSAIVITGNMNENFFEYLADIDHGRVNTIVC